jgi:DNA-binding MarR family transcriptional regulator
MRLHTSLRDGGMASSSGVDAWAAVLRLHATMVPVLDRELQAACGMSIAWYDLLLKLYRAPDGRLSMNQLGDASVLSRSRVSRLVDEMVQAGIVTREANPADKRSSFATLTDEGRARFRVAAPVHVAGIEKHFSAYMTDAEAGLIAGALTRVLEAR